MFSPARWLRGPARQRLALCLGLCLVAGGPGLVGVQAQPAGAGPGIYTCVDARGKRLTSDRPIAECTGREQRILNQDGSVRQVLPPTLTPEERLAQEAAERRAALQRNAQADAVRRDRNLVARYPDEASHKKAREQALAPSRQAMRASEQRLAKLAAERRALDSEAEFYAGRSMPAYLKQQLDANDAAVAAQQAATKAQETEMARVVALYDAELDRLRRLWSGAPLGSLPPLVVPAVRAPAASQPVKAASGR